MHRSGRIGAWNLAAGHRQVDEELDGAPRVLASAKVECAGVPAPK